MEPCSRIENTMIGMRFSWASANAVASMIFSRRSSASWWVELLVTGGTWVALRIGRIDAVHVRRFENGFAAHFGGAQHRGGVGGEIGIAGTAGEDDDAIVFEMP